MKNNTTIYFQEKKEVYFETIKCEDFEIFNLNYHKKRMADSTGINFELQEYIYPPSKDLLKAKVIYDKNEILDIRYDSYKIKEFSSFKLIYDDQIEYKYKYLNREELDRLSSLKEANDDIIIVKNNLVTDTSIANIAVLYDNQWLTPKTPLLLGTTRQRYLDLGEIKESDISVAMLKNSSKIALLNAMIDFKILDKFTVN